MGKHKESQLQLCHDGVSRDQWREGSTTSELRRSRLLSITGMNGMLVLFLNVSQELGIG
jgi:hypothetical protein